MNPSAQRPRRLNARQRMEAEVAQEIARKKARTPHAYELEGLAYDRINRTLDEQERAILEMLALSLSLEVARGVDVDEETALQLRMALVSE